MSSKVSYVNEDLEDQEIQLSINDQRGSYSGLHRRRTFDSQPARPIRSARTGESYYSEGERSDENQTFWTKCLSYLKPSWNITFVISCVIAVTLDPLFFYIPILDETKKCLHKDVQLKNYALVLRSIFDLAFIGHIVYLIRLAIRDARLDMDDLDDEQTAGNSTGFVKKFWDSLENFDTIVDKLKWGSFMLDILCVLPIPQVLLVVAFYQMGDTGYLDRRKFLNFFLLIQYVVRIYRIYISCNKIKHRSGVVAKGLFQFTLYIISGHIFGAFWYFFAIQRETSCWYQNCDTECKKDYSIYCGNTNITEATQKVIDNLNKVCTFDSDFGFGIFEPALKFHYTGSKNFSKKLSFCFWWGLRNLSNYGTNLSETSDYPWEILFAVLVSVSGLLIFLYLIGNVQTYMQNQAEKAKKEEIRQKMNKKAENLKSWMSINRVPDDLKEVILQDIEERLEDNPDADVDNLFSALSFETRKDLKRYLCMDALKGLPGLQGMDEKVVKMMCDYLKPVILSEKEVFAKEGAVADRMILISEGSMEVGIESIGDGVGPAGKGSKITLGKNDFYGHEQLLSWAAPGNLLDFNKLPKWSETVKCRTKVEGFALSAKDLQSIVHKCRFLWRSPNH